jgi:hypothetical protein
VMLSAAFLAEAAAAVDNKLNVQGGVLCRYTVGPDRVANFMLVVLTQPGDDDSDPRVEVAIWPPSADAPKRASFEAPESVLGEFPGFAFFGIDVVLPSDGRWVVDVSSGGETVSLPLVVSSWTPTPLGI